MQARLEAMEEVVNLAQQPAAADNAVVFVQAMAHLPGWDEKNFQASDGTWMHVWACMAAHMAPAAAPNNARCMVSCTCLCQLT